MANPADIEAFWCETLARLARVPLDEREEVVRDPQPYLHSRVTFLSLGGARIVAQLGRPIGTTKGNDPRRLPAIVAAPGYGGWEFGQTLSECQRGYLMLQVYPRLQGESGPAPEGPEHLLSWHWMERYL